MAPQAHPPRRLTEGTPMTTKTHTPGPWTLDTVRTSSGLCHKIGPFPWKPNKDNHACIYVDYPSHDGSAARDQELLANARLIAASPDLLKALSACKGYMLNAVIDLETSTPKATTKNTLNGGIRMIDEAIARATTP